MYGGRIGFLDDYDMHVAHYLVHGCDVWLNNPRKPLEASGTSGMKASVNGVPHLSIGDGWWAEGFNGRNGWLIESHTNPDDQEATDAADADSLYRLLESEIVPAFYDRDERGVPRRLGPVRARGDAVQHPPLLHPAHGQAVHHRDVHAGRVESSEFLVTT